MTDVDGDEGFLADPETIIAAAVTVVEPHLSNATIHAAINQAATTRTQRRRLAIALTSAPELLTSGHPQGPPQIESLISALRATGAQRVTPPRCAHCGRALHLPHRDGDLRICTGAAGPSHASTAAPPRRSPPEMRTAGRAARTADPANSRTPPSRSSPT
jgi:hypothetical protein